MLLECVNELKESDILSDDLFIELLSLESSFEREKKLQEVQNRAEELKLKPRFNKLYKAFVEDNKKELSMVDMPSFVTEFDGQPELRSGVWRAGMDGIWTLSDKGKIFACSHPIYPKTILFNIETRTCKVELVFFVRNKWSSVYVDRKVIASRTSIVSLASHGIRVTSENAGALVQYLSDIESLNEFDITEKNSTSRLGWINGSFMPYEDGVIFDNENNVLTLFESIHTAGSYEKWLKCVIAERKNRRMEVLMYLAASFASVLVEPLGILPFIVALWGGTGKGKTVTLMMAASIWADPNEGEYITDAKSTTTAMEIRLDVLNSLPMLIDDMAQIKNKVDDFGQLIYMLCSGSGKGRATKEAGLRPQTSWKNCIITNSEHSLVSETMQGGAINRVIDVECADKDIYSDGHAVSDVIRSNYGYAGKEFVSAVQMMDVEEIQKIQKSYFERLIMEAKAKGAEKEQKQLIPMAVLLTADELAEKFIFKDGVRLDFDTCLDLLKNKNDISEGIRAYNYLIETIISNSYRFMDPDDDHPEHFERWGKFISSDKVAVIGRYFDKIIADAGSQSKSFLSWAKSMDIIETDSSGKSKKVVDYDGEKLRSVVILRNWGLEDDFELADDSPFQ